MSVIYLNEVANKLNVTDSKILRKAKELLNILDNRPPLSCSESCKIVICLELASSISATGGINRENAIKYSGCKRSVYVNMFNIISKMVNLDKVYTIKELCLTLGISEVQNTADSLLKNYKKTEKLNDDEANHPMIPCATVWAACRMNKVKINTKVLVEMSRVKKSQLESLMLKLEQLGESAAAKSVKKRGSKTLLIPDSSSSLNDLRAEKEPKLVTDKDKEEEYQKWMERMLAE